ncbi:AEC family transporter [Naumannella halotolerans]|uniref:AEC family transporter n=1 Tax=Naumannella halotolerans TaxID=993414 RepID=UPI00370DBC2A
MAGVLSGFFVIAAVIATGWLLAHLKILDAKGQVVLSRVTFHVATPALTIVLIGGSDVRQLFSSNLIASVTGVVITAVLSIIASIFLFRRKAQDTVIGAFCSSYVNAGNLGIPIATYVIGDPAVLAPMLLTQILILQPGGLAVLDVLDARGSRAMTRGMLIRMAILRPVRNPITIGAIIGLILALTGWELPELIAGPIDLIAGMAIPCMLIGYGISLRTGPLPGRGGAGRQIALIAVLKLLVQPVIVYLVATLGLGLTGLDLLAVVIIAALPTAQNVFVFAVRYNAGLLLARDSVFVTTVLSVPVILVITGLLA